MPYIITTRQTAAYAGADGKLATATRRAVATLEEAREAIKPIILGASPHHVWHLAESGGTIGPLPDGTVIEVVRVELRKLREDAGLPHHPGGYRPGQVIDAYNAQAAEDQLALVLTRKVPQRHPEHDSWKAHSIRLAARVRKLEAVLQETTEHASARAMQQIAREALDSRVVPKEIESEDV